MMESHLVVLILGLGLGLGLQWLIRSFSRINRCRGKSQQAFKKDVTLPEAPTDWCLPAVPHHKIFDLYCLPHISQALSLAIEFDIFSHLREEVLSKEALSVRTQVAERSMAALLAVLSALELISFGAEGYHLSPLAQTYLVKDQPFYWGHLLRIAITPLQRKAFQYGKPIVTDIQQWRQGKVAKRFPEFLANMHAHTLVPAIALAQHALFQELKSLLDIGGGSGSVAIALKQAHPHLDITIVELPKVIPLTQQYLNKYGFASQIEIIGQDMFFSDWPSKPIDAILFSNVWHNWAPEVVQHLAVRSFKHLREGGRILIHEILLDDSKNDPLAAAVFSFVMLNRTQGQQFTVRVLEEILRKCGFVDIVIEPSFAYYSLVHARKQNSC